MRASPIIVNWHSENAPIYSADFQPHGKGRLATAGGDNNVRLWKVDTEAEDTKVEYLCTMAKHTQAVNVVRWAPKGDTLASASDDGNVITWVMDTRAPKAVFGEDRNDDKEWWRTKVMVRAMGGSEVYDLAWSPDGAYFITGSMDNVARIYNAQNGHTVRQIAEHQHYVQGVSWDPLNEYIATQSSDRSVHIYTLRTKDGTYTLANREDTDKGLGKVAMNIKMDLPGRRISNSPAPETGSRSQSTHGKDMPNEAVASPGPSCPSTPTSLAMPMNPPSTISHSRRSSITVSSPAMSCRRSASPAPSLPLPAVWPIEASPKSFSIGMGVKNANIYANEMLKSYFRRLTFSPDGSLLLTPAGQYQSHSKTTEEGMKNSYEVTNTVYIYTRGGINKPPIAHLPGHKKPPVVVKCSPIFYNPRKNPSQTKHLTIDTSSADDNMIALPEPATAIPKSIAASAMEPPPPLIPTTEQTGLPSVSNSLEVDAQGPPMAFSLPYRMVYAVATEDSIFLYDTQQQTPICIVSNLHCATFTDLTWSNDGLILLITSSDGFCSTITFSVGELGEKYCGDIPNYKNHHLSMQTTPLSTPTTIAPPSPFANPNHRTAISGSPEKIRGRNRQNRAKSSDSAPPLPHKNIPEISSCINPNTVINTPIQILTCEAMSTTSSVGIKRDVCESETAVTDRMVKKQKPNSPAVSDEKPHA